MFYDKIMMMTYDKHPLSYYDSVDESINYDLKDFRIDKERYEVKSVRYKYDKEYGCFSYHFDVEMGDVLDKKYEVEIEKIKTLYEIFEELNVKVKEILKKENALDLKDLDNDSIKEGDAKVVIDYVKSIFKMNELIAEIFDKRLVKTKKKEQRNDVEVIGKVIDDL